MGEIISILMRRDHMSYKEATDLLDITRDEILEAMNDGCSCKDVEDIIACNLGLEPDYLIYLLP